MDIISFYKDDRRWIFLAAVFTLILLILLFIDLTLDPYPPILLFTDTSMHPIDGYLLINDTGESKVIGETDEGLFRWLPQNFCDKDQIISLQTYKGTFTWEIEKDQACLDNVIQLVAAK